MFEKPKKNRRRTAAEMEGEIEISKLFKRPPTPYIFDTPFYPYLPPAPKVPFVNFDLGFNKGLH